MSKMYQITSSWMGQHGKAAVYEQDDQGRPVSIATIEMLPETIEVDQYTGRKRTQTNVIRMDQMTLYVKKVIYDDYTLCTYQYEANDGYTSGYQIRQTVPPGSVCWVESSPHFSCQKCFRIEREKYIDASGCHLLSWSLFDCNPINISGDILLPRIANIWQMKFGFNYVLEVHRHFATKELMLLVSLPFL